MSVSELPGWAWVVVVALAVLGGSVVLGLAVGWFMRDRGGDR